MARMQRAPMRRARVAVERVGAATVVMGLAAAVLVVALDGAPRPAAGQTPTSSEVPGTPFPLPGLLPVPDPLPDVPAGTVLDHVSFTPGPFPFAVEAHQVLFRSTDRFGAPDAVSGTVLVPVGVPAPEGGRGVVAWAHGTSGLTDCNAPSLDAQAGGRVNSTSGYDRVVQLLAAGHVVTSSDYPGLGTPGVHPYLDGVGEGRSVLDSVRAARPFGGTGPAVLVGFSQGSQAALFAGQEWPTYAPDVDLRAVVPIGTPSLYGSAFAARDLPVVQSYIRYLLAGIVAGRPDLDRSLILTPAGEAAYDAFAAGADLAPGEVAEDPACTYPDFDLDRDLRADPMTVPAWRAAFEANYPGQQQVEVPVLMVQSEADEQALMFLAAGVCRDLEANGTDVRMWRYDDESHVGTVDVSSDDRATWVLDRLAGRPLTDGVGFVGEEPDVVATCPADVVPPATEPPGTDPTPTTPRPGPTAPPAVPVAATADFTG